MLLHAFGGGGGGSCWNAASVLSDQTNYTLTELHHLSYLGLASDYINASDDEHCPV